MLRYIVERISDGKFLELELPISVSGAGQALCGAGRFSGTVVPVADAYRFAGTDQLIDPYATFIHEEADGVIRGTWVVTRSEVDGFDWKIEGAGFSSPLSGHPYEGEYRGVKVDMASVVRELWGSLQRFTSSRFGVTVEGMTGVVRGTDSDEKAAAAKLVWETAKQVHKVAADKRKAKYAELKKRSAPYDAQIKRLNDEAKPLRDAYAAVVKQQKPARDAYTALNKERALKRDAYNALVKAKAPDAQIAAAKAAVDAMKEPIDAQAEVVKALNPVREAAKAPVDTKNAQIKVVLANKAVVIEPLRAQYEALKEAEEAPKEALDLAKDKHDAAKEQAQKDGGAWKILWWDTPDSSQEMQEAIDEAGWEWYEWSGWNADRTRVLKQIRLVPRVGRRQTNLRFVGEANIIEPVVVESDVSQYANTVLAIGAGEGRDALRVTVGATDTRRRKLVAVDMKHITRKASLEVAARAELRRRMRRLSVDAIRVDASHPNAEKGTFGVGDEILIDAEIEHLGRVRLWRRIEEIEWIGLDEADLKLGDV
ncbi:hypothetical protein [Leucobacter luti]|uniref:ReqiPepy6 Gp37-like protein n=1 Tax=Leucobacter luti TaxID=340320 RepID=A0A4Q7U2S8_9MICO|nr:hypothetical protein [Leucobacter luti]MBL3699227.1 hypothetical protein [Leucobacter luti]RZT66728.1 hypothetical protein EV139_0855 [Leucobacter luti]